ncbi:hypothetical protein D9611_012158 [Ephemerocybe angulata]|uniref:Uncharacterized protein n=1 Tax=Ephemerocybe angulata TaxID=980116 RepID=A0A8H5C5I6_9AGAR|nr:hypothetical protein D9611_012158 [Tulosesus angulatus]
MGRRSRTNELDDVQLPYLRVLHAGLSGSRHAVFKGEEHIRHLFLQNKRMSINFDASSTMTELTCESCALRLTTTTTREDGSGREEIVVVTRNAGGAKRQSASNK